MDNYFPLFHWSLPAFSRNVSHYLLWVGLKMPELEGSSHRHTHPSTRASWDKEKKNKNAAFFFFLEVRSLQNLEVISSG